MTVKDFDEARREREDRDRQFTIGGQTFTFRPSVSPEALLPYHRAITGEVKTTEEEWIDIYDLTVVAMLDPGQDDAWKAVRSPDVPNPLNAKDIADLLMWLLEQQSGRPTGEPSGSTASSDATATGSKDEPSSPVVPVLVASTSDRSAA